MEICAKQGFSWSLSLSEISSVQEDRAPALYVCWGPLEIKDLSA